MTLPSTWVKADVQLTTSWSAIQTQTAITNFAILTRRTSFARWLVNSVMVAQRRVVLVDVRMARDLRIMVLALVRVHVFAINIANPCLIAVRTGPAYALAQEALELKDHAPQNTTNLTS